MTTAKSSVTTSALVASPPERDADATMASLDAHARGKVEVSAQAIATIAAQAATACYGVVGVTANRQRPGAVQRLAPTELARGVDVRFVADHVVIDVGVILEHNLRVIEVAHNIMVIVKYAVEQALGLHVARVNVNVQALRVRE